MVQENQGYEEQIFDILRLKGGCVIGFNKLKNMRPGGKMFHPTALSKATAKLEKENKISITKIKVGKHEQNEYRIIETKIDEAWQKLYEKHFKLIERSLKNRELTDSEKIFLTHNYVKQALYLHDMFRAMLFSPDSFDIDTKRTTKINLLNERIMKEVQNKINKLSVEQRSKLLNSINPTQPKLYSLNEYREMIHEETQDEKYQKEIALENQRDRSFQDEPFCMFCGVKAKNYKESDKHQEIHIKNFQKNTIQSMKAFEGFYCTRCGKLVGDYDKMEKHRCKIQNRKNNGKK